MDSSEFLLSKLDSAIASSRSIDLTSSLTSGILGLASVFLALAAILPPSSFLGPIRFFLFLSTGAVIVVLYIVIRRLTRNRKERLAILRKWHQEVFFARARVQTFEQQRVRKMIELVQSIEDSNVTRNPQYDSIDTQFMSMLNTVGQ